METQLNSNITNESSNHRHKKQNTIKKKMFSSRQCVCEKEKESTKVEQKKKSAKK